MSDPSSEPMMIRLRVEAEVAAVHRALTEAAALRTWFSEHAEVALPDTYEFWGPTTPAGDVPRQRPLHVDERTLRFGWRVDDTDTVVEISLAESAPGETVLTLTQTGLPGHDAMVAETTTLSQLHTFWALSLVNLVDFVEGRELTPKCDFTTPEMRAELLIDAAPRAVFDSLLDGATFSRWFGARVEVEPHLGGRWAMGGLEHDPEPAKIVELEPGRALALAWDEGLAASWELEGSEGRTRLTFVQSGFDGKRPPYGAWMGWLSGFAELRRFHELADWRPRWLEVRVQGMPEHMLVLE